MTKIKYFSNTANIIEIETENFELGKNSISRLLDESIPILAEFLASQNWKEVNMTGTFSSKAKNLKKAIAGNEGAEKIAALLSAYKTAYA